MTALTFACVLAAIAAVETNGSDAKIGRHGERGRYQFKRATWTDRTTLPFAQAHDRDSADKVAKWHVEWLVQSGATSAFWVAVGWHSGLTAVQTGHVNAEGRDYGMRVANLAYYYETNGIPEELIPTSVPLTVCQPQNFFYLSGEALITPKD